MRTAYSYKRYSSEPQGDGDSFRRQTAAAEAWCKRHPDVRLDRHKQMEDRGLSAHDGTHIRSGALGQFLAEVAAGRIAEGSILIVENLDRLSRENPWDAIAMLCQLVNAGIAVVTLSPSEMTYERGSSLTALVTAVVEFGRSNGESATKGINLRGAWGKNKNEARELARIITRQIPKWTEIRDGEIVPIPERRAAVEKIFDLAINGLGVKAIMRQLVADGVQPFGYRERWCHSSIYAILKGRTVCGEYQPHVIQPRKSRLEKKVRAKEGAAVADYYPRIIDENTWHRAQAAIAGRFDGDRPKGGRRGRAPDLFAGKLRDAGRDCKMRVLFQTRGPKGRRKKCRVLGPADGLEGMGPMITFPYRVFEAAILKRLKEVDPAEVLGAEPASESAALAGEHARKLMRLKAIEAELAGDGKKKIATLARAADKLEHECQVILKKLTEARGREANPRGEALEEFKTLADVAKDPESRLRLRSLLNHFVDSIDVLIVPRRSIRLAAVQVNFAGGEARRYFIDYRPAAHCRKEVWDVDSFKRPGTRHDLRTADGVASMRRFLDKVHDALDAGGDRPAL